MDKLNKGREITHNIHGVERTCNRCSKKPTVIKVKSDHLCEVCRIKRIERQRQNRSFEHKSCQCGRMIRTEQVLCRDCDDKADEAETERHEFEQEMLLIESFTTIDEIKSYLISKLAASQGY